MKELKQELEVIFNEHKRNYQSKYNKVDSVLAQATNFENFEVIFNKFIDDIIEKSNDFLEIDKTERESYLKKLIKDFNLLSINPFR